MHTSSDTLPPWESLEYLNQFWCVPQIIFTTYNSSYVILEKHLIFSQQPVAMQVSPKVRKEKERERKGELIRLYDKADLSSSIKNNFLDSQPPEYLK